MGWNLSKNIATIYNESTSPNFIGCKTTQKSRLNRRRSARFTVAPGSTHLVPGSTAMHGRILYTQPEYCLVCPHAPMKCLNVSHSNGALPAIQPRAMPLPVAGVINAQINNRAGRKVDRDIKFAAGDAGEDHHQRGGMA